MLAIPDFAKQFVVETDACDSGVGAVLMQAYHPVAFMSKALGPIHQKLSIYEKEFLALILAVEKWRQYLQPVEFVIKTDHRSLSYLDEQQLQSDLQRKAMTRLMGLKFKIVYRQGKENFAADALSRVGHCFSLQAISECKPLWLQEVLNSYATDPAAQLKLSKLALASPDDDGYILDNGIIHLNGRIWIGCNSALQTKLISTFHSTAIGGHSGIHATYQRLKKLVRLAGIETTSGELRAPMCRVSAGETHIAETSRTAPTATYSKRCVARCEYGLH